MSAVTALTSVGLAEAIVDNRSERGLHLAVTLLEERRLAEEVVWASRERAAKGPSVEAENALSLEVNIVIYTNRGGLTFQEE